ncbi:MAG TPA: hypothetical protein VFY42_04910, partial [Gemmatimonadales bacterium]|nr:hypothetical protein [Gemmatimonadales bacterium]
MTQSEPLRAPAMPRLYPIPRGANTTVTGWVVRLDPDFHHKDAGFLVDSGGGSVGGRSVTIPGSRMT